MTEQCPYATAQANSRQANITQFRTIAQNGQAPLVADLAQFGSAAVVNEQFWVINGIHLLATPDVIRWLSLRKDVAVVYDDAPIFLIDAGTDSTGGGTDTPPRWNITKVSAPTCWSAGYDGTGVIVARPIPAWTRATWPCRAGSRATGTIPSTGSRVPTTTTATALTPWARFSA